MRASIVFIGEENRTNNELFQLLNWRFKVTYYNSIEGLSFEVFCQEPPQLIIVSMVGNNTNYQELFEYMAENCRTTSVVTISAQTQSDPYESFYETEQFHKVLRPVTGRKILEICRAILRGEGYEAGEAAVADTDVKRHILVVDDNAMILRNIKGILENHYTVAVAPSGVHAFISIGKKLPDLILLDYEMPEMNGKEVMEKLQADEELREIPIVFLTSADSREVVLELLALKPAGYILKPAEPQALLDRIEEIIGK